MAVDNFAMINGRKACAMTKVSEFCIEKAYNSHISAFKYSLPSLHKNIATCEIILNLTKMHGFYPVLHL